MLVRAKVGLKYKVTNYSTGSLFELATEDYPDYASRVVVEESDSALDITKTVITVGTAEADYITDGVADNVQIQSAIDAVTAAGGTILLKAGTYQIIAPIVMKAKVRLTGEGRGTVLAGSGTGFSVIQGFGSVATPIADVEVSNLMIDGTGLVDSPYSTNTKGIYMTHLKRAKFLNLYVYNTPATGIGTDFLIDSLVHGCVVQTAGRQYPGTGYGSNGIGIGTGEFEEESLIVSDCITVGCGNNGIMFEQQFNDIQSKVMMAVNCISYDNRVGFRASGNQKVIFSNCQAYTNTAFGVVLDESGLAQTPNPKEIVVSNSIVAGNGGPGIVLNDVSNTALTFTITGNQIHDNSDIGIKILGGQRILIQGNHIYENDRDGIKLYTNSVSALINNVLINGNFIYNNGQAGLASANDGVRLEQTTAGSFDGVMIRNNRIFDDQGVKKQRYGVTISGTHTNTTIEGNDVRGNNTGTINVATASTTCVVKNNTGHNPQGIASVTPGASPYTYTAGNTPETVYVTGGTVSTIVKSGTTLYADTGHNIELEPNESVVVTYSVAPTMVKDRH